MLWRVGNGETVRIWKDKWLPAPLSTLFYSPQNRLEENSKVSALIDKSSRWWNVQLLQDNFSADEIARICSICPSPSQTPDTIYWKGTSHGQFSVRSAYFLEQNRQNQFVGESSGAREEEKFWQDLWKIETPTVVKNFLWKVGNDLLSTKVNLFKKRVVSDPGCPFCLQEREDVVHSLWMCKSSMAVWQDCGKKIQKLAIGQVDGKGLLQFLFKKLEGEDLMMAVVLLRLIWLRRNAFVFEGEFTPPGSLVLEAQRVVREFTAALSSTDELQVAPPGQPLSWIPPPLGTIKINWAAFLNPAEKRTGIGVLIRNDKGELLAAQANFLPSLLKLNMATARGAWHAVKLESNIGASHVHLEGDNMEVLAALRKSGPCESSYGHLIEEAKIGIQRLPQVAILHACKEANVAATCLAKLASLWCLDNVWMGNFPPLIWNVLSAKNVSLF